MPEPDPVDFLGTTADEQLLAADAAALPAVLGRPEVIPRSPRRGGVVGVGATMTGVSLVGGIILAAVGAIDALANGSVFALVLLVLGVVLVATHWGWVHVAELTANRLDAGVARPVVERNRQWLATLKPFTHYEVATRVAEDGSIWIVRSRYLPVRSGETSFTYAREIQHEELHSGEESAAAVTERAELLRRQAALDTERERERFQIAADVYETHLLNRGDEQERLAARRAASAALSEQINQNLRDPPLIE